MDLYEELGVARDASQDDIQKAYRKLAKELHPDLHPGDKSAEEKFKTVSSAYHLLKDPKTRARYDAGEIDESGAERPPQNFYRPHAEGAGPHFYQSTAGFEDFADISDLFGGAFGGGRGARSSGGIRIRGGDVSYQLSVGFMEAVKGAKKRITMPDGKTLDLSIPAGTRDGNTLRLKGKGMAGIGGGPNGDALVKIIVETHPFFTRRGDDILIDLPITIDEAVLGAKVTVPTISGAVSMTIKPGTSGGETLRLKGKGLARRSPGKGNSTNGDQLVRIVIKMPDKIDDGLKEFMEGWRQDHAYDPRADLTEAKV